MSVSETLTPSVEGGRKAVVAGLLAAAAAATGALAGFAAGAVATAMSLGNAPPAVTTVIVAAAVAADLSRRPRPWAVRRQVPRVWSELFSPETVAVLYGARLGVGPLTILPTWLWWAAFLLGTLAGPFTAAAAGAVFGLTRAVVMVSVGEWACAAMPERVGRLRAFESAGGVLIGGAAVLAGLAVLV